MFALILPMIMPLISGLITPFVKAWTDYKTTQLKTNEAGFAAAVTGDVQTTQAILQADVADNAIKVQLYGTGIYRFVTWIVGVPVALHFSFVFVDTILASKFLFARPVLGVPLAPGEFGSIFEWAIISSFFILHAVHGNPSNVMQWLAPPKK